MKLEGRRSLPWTDSTSSLCYDLDQYNKTEVDKLGQRNGTHLRTLITTESRLTNYYKSPAAKESTIPTAFTAAVPPSLEPATTSLTRETAMAIAISAPCGALLAFSCRSPLSWRA